MPTPEAIRPIALALVFVIFLMGFRRAIFFPIAFMLLLLGKFATYYPGVHNIKLEAILGILGLILVTLQKGDLIKQLTPSHNAVNKYLMFLLGAMGISFAVSWDPAFSWNIKLYDFLKVIILYAMFMVSIRDEKDLKIAIWAFVATFAYLTYEPVYYFLTGSRGRLEYYGIEYIARFGVLSGHVALANNMNQMIPIALFLALSCKKKMAQAVAFIFLCLFVVALIASKSRGGVAGFAFCMLTIIYFSKNRIKTGIIGLIFLAGIFLFSGSLKETAARINENAAHGRLEGLFHGVEMLLKGNVLGVGPGCYLLARQKYFHYRMESHNIYGQVLGDLGIPGAIAWFLFLREIFKNLERTKKKLVSLGRQGDFLYKVALGIEVSLIVRLFVSLGSHGLYYLYWYVMAAFSIAIFTIARQQTAVEIKSVGLEAKQGKLHVSL